LHSAASQRVATANCWYVAVCCSVLQCVAVCCSVLQMCCSVLQCVAVCCSVLQQQIAGTLPLFRASRFRPFLNCIDGPHGTPTHARVHTRAHTRAHAHTHAYSRSHTHTRTHALSPFHTEKTVARAAKLQISTLTHTCVHALSHTHIHIQIHMHTTKGAIADKASSSC